MKRPSAKKQTARQASREEGLIKDLLKVKRQYERYFKTLEKPDGQALSSYAGILKTAAELLRKLGPETEANDPEEMKKIAEEILESEYGIKRN